DRNSLACGPGHLLHRLQGYRLKPGLALSGMTLLEDKVLQMAIRVLSTKLFQNPGDLLYLACGGQFRKDRAPGVEYYAKFIADLQALPDPGGYTPYARGHLIGGLIKLSFQVQEDFVHHIRLQQPPQP